MSIPMNDLGVVRRNIVRADKAAVEQAALALEDVQRILAGAAPKKIIVVPGRIVNIVA